MNQKGFTLVELVVVIVVLGILAAVAVPKFVDLTSESRSASVNGAASGIRSAVALAKAQYMVTGDMTATAVTMEGNAIEVAAGTGIPTGTTAGIGAAMDSLDGYDIDYTTATDVTIQPKNGGSATCGVTYNGTTGAVSTDVTGC